MSIIIDTEFKSQIPPQTLEENAALETSMLAEGCRAPLTVWDNILIDGHHRYDICKKHNIEYHFVDRDFASREAAAAWIDENQLSRRNLSKEQMSLIRGRQYNRMKKQGLRTDLTSAQNEQKLPVAETLAKIHNVSPATIRRDAAKAAGKIKTKSTNVAVVRNNEPPSAKPDPVGKEHSVSDNRLSAALKNIDSLKSQVAGLRSRVNDLMVEKKEAINLVKHWKKKAEKSAREAGELKLSMINIGVQKNTSNSKIEYADYRDLMPTPIISSGTLLSEIDWEDEDEMSSP